VEEHQLMPMPMIIGCDLNSKPDDAAYDMIIGKDIFDKSSPWHIPSEVPADSKRYYELIEENFHSLLDSGKLDPVIYSMQSVYETCVYSHGLHTSRAPTCYAEGKRGMYDHIFYNDNHLKVLKMLEIPQEKYLAPGLAGDES
jgi:hypothetical protein